MDRFLSFTDELGEHINRQAEYLYGKLKNIDVYSLKMPYHCQEYFIGSHSSRLFFSIQTSAHIIYRSIKLLNKKPGDIVFLDYGAGVGTLFLLAKLTGCKKVIYSDHLDDWRKSAEIIANATGIEINSYLVNDYRECLEELKRQEIHCDIIASRNVVEHIYNLSDFFKAVHDYQPAALIFSSTTANIKNPGSVLRHRMIHKRWEKEYLPLRRKIIAEIAPNLNESEYNILAEKTRGLAMQDLKAAVENFIKDKSIPDPSKFRTNTCQPENGLWAENLLSFEEYIKYINPAIYKISFQPGFWDTHYSKTWKNIVGKTFNTIKNLGRTAAFAVAPFIYIIAEPLNKK